MPDGLTSLPGPYDAVTAIAVLMHLPETDATSLMPLVFDRLSTGGLFLFSVCVERDGLDACGIDPKGRFFLIRPATWWIAQCTQAGFTDAECVESNDSLGRPGIHWVTIKVAKPT